MEHDAMDPDGKGNPAEPAPRLLSRRSKWLTTFAIYLGNVCFGASNGSYGPALVDFTNKYETTIDDISVIITILIIAYLFGCLTTGFAYKFINRQLGVILLLSGMATSMFLTPHCPTQLSLYSVAGLLGFCCGAYEATQVVWILEMWQAAAGPFVQAQSLFIGIGFLTPSLILAPFLTAEHDMVAGLLTRSPDVYIPFSMIGGLSTLAALFQAYLFTFHRYCPPPPEEGRQDSMLETVTQDGLILPTLKPRINYRRIQLIILAAVFFGAEAGIGNCTNAFLSAFAQYGSLRLSQQEGAYLLSGLTGAVIVGRLIGILAVLKVRPQIIVCLNLVVIIIANGILLLFADTSYNMLWAGSILLGFGLSTTIPSFVTVIERHLVFTNRVGSILLIISSSVAAAYPLVVGKYIDQNTRVLMYTNFFSLAWMVLVGILLFKLIPRRSQARN